MPFPVMPVLTVRRVKRKFSRVSQTEVLPSLSRTSALGGTAIPATGAARVILKEASICGRRRRCGSSTSARTTSRCVPTSTD